ncbi:MAG: hypothetical protein ACREQF_08415, partial [Candidatus Binataceae bacterium]
YTFNALGMIELARGNVIALTATASGGDPLVDGVDYSLDRVSGFLRALEGGAVGAGDTIQVSFSYADQVVAEAGQDAPLA